MDETYKLFSSYLNIFLHIPLCDYSVLTYHLSDTQ